MMTPDDAAEIYGSVEAEMDQPSFVASPFGSKISAEQANWLDAGAEIPYQHIGRGSSCLRAPHSASRLRSKQRSIKHESKNGSERPIIGGHMTSTLAGLLDFIILFVVALALIALYLAIYTLATMHNEFALIRHNVISAATALGFSLVASPCRSPAPSCTPRPSSIA